MDSLFNQADQPEERDEILNKWKDKPQEELLKAKVESDLYIKTLEKQKDELRADYLRAHEDLKARANLQELIDQLNTSRQSQPPVTEGNTEKPIDLKELESLFDKKFEQKKQLDIETANYSQVQSKLQERYGQNAGSILKQQANSLGLSEDDVNSLARRSPEAFFRMMGLNQQPTEVFTAPPRSDIRNDHFAPHTPKRTWTYYQNMKRTNPSLYHNPKTQVQMHKDASTLGVEFEDGDFNAYGSNY